MPFLLSYMSSPRTSKRQTPLAPRQLLPSALCVIALSLAPFCPHHEHVLRCVVGRSPLDGPRGGQLDERGLLRRFSSYIVHTELGFQAFLQASWRFPRKPQEWNRPRRARNLELYANRGARRQPKQLGDFRFANQKFIRKTKSFYNLLHGPCDSERIHVHILSLIHI